MLPPVSGTVTWNIGGLAPLVVHTADVFVVHGYHCAPANPACLQDSQRGVRIDVEEAHPGVDGEDVETVVGQCASVHRVQDAGGL